MKKLSLLLIIVYLNVNAQELKFPEKEIFTASLSFDPKASINEKGLNFAADLEYARKIYIKIGYESFSVLQGGYNDVHWSIGPNLNSGYFDKMRYYAGLRTALVFRDKGHAVNYGLEAGIDYNITDNFYIGAMSTYIKRNEQKVILNWTPETVFSFNVKIGYKWDYKK